MHRNLPPERSNRPFTLLLRVLPRQGSNGRFVGQVEVVETGETVAISDVADQEIGDAAGVSLSDRFQQAVG